MAYVLLIGNKAVLYPLLFQQFLFNVVVIRHFKHGQDLGYARVRVFVDATCVHNTVESGNYLYHCAYWSIPWLRQVS